MSDLNSLTSYKIAFYAHGLSVADYQSLGAAVAKAGVLSFCTDLECVKANVCILGVVSKPNIEIYYSPLASESANISFVTAFTQLTKRM